MHWYFRKPMQVIGVPDIENAYEIHKRPLQLSGYNSHGL
jgi:hypothetical protein